MAIPTIFVATPAFNSVDYIDRAILSVLSQSGRFRIRYHVQDGLSDDGTVERLKWWKDTLESKRFPLNCDQVEFSFESAQDAGMYDALSRAFEKLDVPDDAFATWINSDDIIVPGAFAALAKLALTYDADDIAWVTGRRSTASADGIPREPNWPVLSPGTQAIAAGLCDSVHIGCIQQEGTAFRGWLWNAAKDQALFEDCRLAGDWLLWTKMARRADLYQLQVPLGRFHHREGQLSANMDDYLAEIDRFIPTAARTEAFFKFLLAEDAVCNHLFYDDETDAFTKHEVSADRYTFARQTFYNRPELADRVVEAVPTVAVFNTPLSQFSDSQLFTFIEQFVDSAKLRPVLRVRDELTDRRNKMAARQERFVRLTNRHVQHLAGDPNLSDRNWKHVAKRHPWKIGLWLAIRRFERSRARSTNEPDVSG